MFGEWIDGGSSAYLLVDGVSFLPLVTAMTMYILLMKLAHMALDGLKQMVEARCPAVLSL